MPPPARRVRPQWGGKGLWTPPAYHRALAPGRSANRRGIQGAPEPVQLYLEYLCRSPPGVLELL
eukprot:1373587-Alexandrium_andersonii.AAC.1